MLPLVVCVVVLILASTFGATAGPRGSRAADAVSPAGSTTAASTPARMPRVALFRRNLLISAMPLFVVHQPPAPTTDRIGYWNPEASRRRCQDPKPSILNAVNLT